MKLTFRGDYALKAVLELALHYGSELVSSYDLAKRIDAPAKFLEQVLAELKKAGLVESKRGNAGGYMLAKAPREITVGDVVRVVEGPIEPIACVSEKYTACSDIRGCIFRGIWQQVYRSISEIIDDVNYEDLAAQVRDKGEGQIAYSI